MIALYYYENLTLREIARYSVFPSRGYAQLHTKAVIGLRSASSRNSSRGGPQAA